MYIVCKCTSFERARDSRICFKIIEPFVMQYATSAHIVMASPQQAKGVTTCCAAMSKVVLPKPFYYLPLDQCHIYLCAVCVLGLFCFVNGET